MVPLFEYSLYRSPLYLILPLNIAIQYRRLITTLSIAITGERKSLGHHLQSFRIQPATQERGLRSRMANRHIWPTHPLRRRLHHQDRGRLEESQHHQPLPGTRRGSPHPGSQAVKYVQHLYHVRQVRSAPVPQVRDPEPV